MSLTFTGSASRDTAAYGGFVDAIGGVATVVLAIIGLSGAKPEMLIAVATIVFGAALLIQGGAMLSEYAGIMFPVGTTGVAMEQFGGSSLSALFLAGAAGIVLGILALLGLQSQILTSVSIIAFGAGLLLSSNSVWQLHALKRAILPADTSVVEGGGGALIAHEMASGSAGVQSLAGLTAVVLGILALANVNAIILDLAALIVLGATLILTGSSLSATVMSFMRPTRSTTSATSATMSR
ncbi:MAG TPA: hypothetical protein VFE63_01355 [Roseiarcus sp.]|jgi:hypothetical protein|nr:hypothetical protein [Roseiarcus sp.]